MKKHAFLLLLTCLLFALSACAKQPAVPQSAQSPSASPAASASVANASDSTVASGAVTPAASASAVSNPDTGKKISYNTKVVLRPDTSVKEVKEESLKVAASVLESRLKGDLIEYSLQTDSAKKEFALSLNFNGDKKALTKLLNDLVKPGVFTFKSEDGKTLLEGNFISKAHADKMMKEDVVLLQFTEEATKQFTQITTDYMGKTIGIYLDGIMLTDPTVENTIANGECYLESPKSADEAKVLANIINSGSLPFKLIYTVS